MAKKKKGSNWLNHFMNFLAVILGVYFAFYVNEQAKSKEEHKEAVQIMKSLVNDLSADIKTYEEYQIPINANYLKEVNKLFGIILKENRDSINSQLPKLFLVENYVPNTSTYNSMRSAGKMNLFENLSLQKQLSDYYEGIAIECQKKNEIQIDFFMNELVNWLTLHADLLEMKILEESQLMVFQNKLMIYESLIDQKVKNYQMIVDESKLLKGQLDSLISSE